MSSENKPNLFLIRHAESMQNVNNNLDRNSSLSERGQLQAAEAGLQLKQLVQGLRLGAIIHTGLRRTIDTAIAIQSSASLGLPLVEMKEFREREMGIYDKMDFTELIARNPGMEALYKKYGSSCVWFFNGKSEEGVEPLQEMNNRVRTGLEVLYNTYRDTPIVLVAHAGSVKMIRMLYENPKRTTLAEYLCSYVPKNCEIYRL